MPIFAAGLKETETLIVILKKNVSNRAAISSLILAFMAVFLLFVPASVLGVGIDYLTGLSGVVVPLVPPPTGNLVLEDTTLALLASDALNIRRSVSIDAESNLVWLQQTVAGVDLSVPLVMSLDS